MAQNNSNTSQSTGATQLHIRLDLEAGIWNKMKTKRGLM